MLRRTQTRGVTLIELLIVISLLSILAAAVMPSSTPGVREQLTAATQRVAADLGYCRSLAITNNSRYHLKFETGNNRYILEHTGGRSALDVLPLTPHRAASDPADQQIVNLANSPLSDSTVRLVAILAGTSPPQTIDAVEFKPLGETTRAEETTVWLTAGRGEDQLYQAIRINPVTGLTWIDPVQKTFQ